MQGYDLGDWGYEMFDWEWLELILSAKHLGLTLDEVRIFLQNRRLLEPMNTIDSGNENT